MKIQSSFDLGRTENKKRLNRLSPGAGRLFIGRLFFPSTKFLYKRCYVINPINSHNFGADKLL